MDKRSIAKNLYDAAKLGDLHQLRSLIDQDSSLIDVDTPFGSLLHVAASKGHLEVVQYLVDSGATINLHGGIRNGTPIDSAASNGHLEVVKYLYKQGALLEVDEPTRNPLFGSIYGNHGDVAKFLIDCGIDTSVRYTGDNMKEMDAIKFAREWGRFDIIAMLEEK